MAKMTFFLSDNLGIISNTIDDFYKLSHLKLKLYYMQTKTVQISLLLVHIQSIQSFLQSSLAE